MPSNQLPQRTVFIAGGGPAALEAALALRTLAKGRLRVELLCPEDAYVQRPLSVLEPFAASGTPEYPLDRLEELGIGVRRGALVAVDPGTRVLLADDGREYDYDFLLVAAGAQAREALPHAATFFGPQDAAALHGVIQDVEGGWSRRIAFVAPPAATWTLPIYELALQTAERAYGLCLDVELTLLTHESAPLEAFGRAGVELATRLLQDAGIELITSAAPQAPQAGLLVPSPGRTPIAVERVVALPIPVGRRFPGLPADARGFIPVDAHARVLGVPRVYAAGDGTDAPIKQGGLATQQAEAAVEAIMMDAGLRTEARPFRPVLRATLITGSGAVYLRRRPGSVDGEVSERSGWWWPTAKIAGSRLAPFLDGLDRSRRVAVLPRAFGARR